MSSILQHCWHCLAVRIAFQRDRIFFIYHFSFSTQNENCARLKYACFYADQNIENYVMHGVLSYIGTLDVR